MESLKKEPKKKGKCETRAQLPSHRSGKKVTPISGIRNRIFSGEEKGKRSGEEMTLGEIRTLMEARAGGKRPAGGEKE